MALLDALTGNAAKTAARNNQYAISSGTNLGASALTTGYGNAQKLLGTGDGSGGNAMAALGSAYGTARSDAMSGQAGAQSFLGQIGDVYSGLTESGRMATDARSDALGLNGADGNARARTAFEGSLGYGAGLDTGLDSVMRSAAARGNLAGGNTSRDLFNYGADYQNKQSGSYIDRLSQAGQNYGVGAAGQAGGLALQGSTALSGGNTLAGLATGFGGAEASLYGTAAGQQTQFGQGVAGLQTNAAGQYVQNNNTLAASQSQASSNLLDTLGGAFTGFSKAGGISGLANLFK